MTTTAPAGGARRVPAAYAGCCSRAATTSRRSSSPCPRSCWWSSTSRSVSPWPCSSAASCCWRSRSTWPAGSRGWSGIRLRTMLGREAATPVYLCAPTRPGLLAAFADPAARPAVLARRRLVAPRAGHRHAGVRVTLTWWAGAATGLTYWFWQRWIPTNSNDKGLAELLGFGEGRTRGELGQPGGGRRRPGHPAAGGAVRRGRARQPGVGAAEQPRRAPARGRAGRDRTRRRPDGGGGVAAPARARHPRRSAAAAGPAQHGPGPGPPAAGAGPRAGRRRPSTRRWPRPARRSPSCGPCRAASRRRCWSTAASPRRSRRC